MSLRSSREERKIYIDTNRYLDEPSSGLELIAKLIAMPELKEETTLLLEKLNKLIHYDFIEACKIDNMPNEAEMYEKILRAVSDLEDLTEFSALSNKNVVAIGGSFSAGKSKFLNSILKTQILPTDTTPTTSIPTYLTLGEYEALYALNSFNNKILIDREAIKAICHLFMKKYNVSFSHIIKMITIELQDFKYDNIALLDTPGYSKSDSMIKGDNTDEKIAREHLRTADQIIWLMDINRGTLNESDLKFIQSLEFERPIFFVLNKAGDVTEERVKEIYSETIKTLNSNHLQYAGIMAYDSLLNEENLIYGDDVSEFLCKINKNVKKTHIKKEFEKILNEFIDYNIKEKNNAQNNLLQSLNEIAIILYDIKSDNKNSLDETIKRLISSAKSTINNSNYAICEFEKLKAKIIEIIDTILNKIKIKDEKCDELGPIGIIKLSHDELQSVKLDNIFEAKVVKINALGVLIKADPFKDNIIVTPDQIKNFYNKPPDKVFKVEEKCKLYVTEIKHASSEIKFAIICQ
ncbi:MAG: dynamin family protein [Candidatus Wallbacteria bacterium]